MSDILSRLTILRFSVDVDKYCVVWFTCQIFAKGGLLVIFFYKGGLFDILY